MKADGGKRTRTRRTAPRKEAGSAVSDGGRPPARQPGVEEIRERAYELFIERGATHGNDLADWFAAEKQLCAKAGSPEP